MAVIKVEGMHCGKCVERIEKAMTSAGLEFKVSLEKHQVEVDGDDNSISTAKEILEDLGFDIL